MTHSGDHLHTPLRLIVAPSAGTFEPASGMQHSGMSQGPTSIRQGQVVGHIVNASDRIAVTSPFAGQMETFLAWPNERLQKHERVLTMRAAS